MIMFLCDNCEVEPCILRPTELERKNTKETDCPYYKNSKQTNADRIRAMSDEELKDFLCGVAKCENCRWATAWLCSLEEWLKQPADTKEE